MNDKPIDPLATFTQSRGEVIVEAFMKRLDTHAVREVMHLGDTHSYMVGFMARMLIEAVNKSPEFGITLSKTLEEIDHG